MMRNWKESPEEIEVIAEIARKRRNWKSQTFETQRNGGSGGAEI
jgi:hypothetical protein